MKKIVVILITLLILIGASYGLSYFIYTKFIDFAFLVGAAITFIIYFFTSKGGYTSKSLDVSIQGSTGIKVDEQKEEFSPSIAFYTSLIYSIITLIILIFQYRSYF